MLFRSYVGDARVLLLLVFEDDRTKVVCRRVQDGDSQFQLSFQEGSIEVRPSTDEESAKTAEQIIEGFRAQQITLFGESEGADLERSDSLGGVDEESSIEGGSEF